MMKTQVILTTIALTGFLLNACETTLTGIKPSDQISTQEYTFSDYDQIETESAFTVYVNFSDAEEKIEIQSNDNLHQYIEVTKNAGKLKIGFKDHVSIKGSSTLNAYITTKNVTGFSASGASRFIVQNDVSGENAFIFLSGASRFSGEIYVENLEADLSGASLLQITGSADNSSFTASGASNINDFTFDTNYLNINLTGASTASLTVNEKMDVLASGASVLRYKGSAMVSSQNLSGSSQLLKTD